MTYTATAGRLSLRSDEGEPTARIFFTAYHAGGKDAEVDASRPVTFCFNGGPGSSSVWLHLGMLGPKRLAFPDDASLARPPFKLVDNAQSLLDVTDLVFIDPVSTGFSRPEDAEKKSDFHGYSEDLRSVGQFIHNYLGRFNRWGSPKFILGESYGGLRVAGLSGMLRDVYNIELSGAVIVSGAVNFQTLRFAQGNDLPYRLFLPAYAATAWYHGRLSDELQKKSVEEVSKLAEDFAEGDYMKTLADGASASDQQRNDTADRYAELTGLSPEYVLGRNLRVHMQHFARELLRDQNQSIGRFDSRYATPVFDREGDTPDYDASAAALFGPFTAAMNHYLQTELNIKPDAAPDGVYEILTGKVHPWNYGQFENQYVNASDSLAEAMTANPYLKLFVAEGWYDLATPPLAMDYTLDQLPLPPQRRENITVKRYAGGHMMYVHEPSLKEMREHLVDWYGDALGE